MTQQPFFSIIIPTYNRPDRLKSCLQALTRLDYPRDRFEVVIVDDGSKTPLDRVIAPYQASLNITLIRQTNAGPANARNTGANYAKGQYLAFTDDDCAPAPDWLTNMAACFARAPEALIGGYTINALSNNLYSTASQILIDYIYSYYNTKSHQSGFFASNNFAMPAERFRTLGGFDTRFPLAAGEDREFCDRWLHHGYPMIYAPKVQIYHSHHLTLKTFWRQHFNYGRGASCFHQVRSQRSQESFKVEPISFYFHLITYPFGQCNLQSAMFLAVLLFISQVANASGFFWERANQSSKQFSWA
ncbi:glycosyltransferase family 2 protein [Leptothermofonsia sp. ETS-13]|uniref:glycosyltransferase family 2 protein n=1 Tax=Leptothermofonsia sp. ETS-13 TaxID=3035696 RepID=UPI003BA1BD55